MKQITAWLALALLSGAAVQAAEKPAVTVVRDYTDIVAPADQQAYEAGMKSFNQCLHQHGFKYTWTAWVHETGDTYSYSYTSAPVPWSTFDEMDAAGKACDTAMRSSVNPHLKSETSAFMQVLPELSHMPKAVDPAPKLIEVTLFTLKPSHESSEAFMANVKKIAAAAEKSKWPYYYQFSRLIDAGDGAPDFILVSPSKSWAELGADPDPDVWKMAESVYGKADAAAMRKAINDAIKDVSSHVDSYNADLTYTASGQ
ncbi:hypothetical protein DWU98_16230 [Dyella monticola]|uniref:Uncharacterized protein n=1 Tax=Dyella monticola TaxID=1927958 RepID=A0A370WTY9_9GAMM|nr:hypothetical protein [Dyella monticola]RDS79619.1 hypothetical protein DWU98_16230 [Dyella monticola]